MGQALTLADLDEDIATVRAALNAMDRSGDSVGRQGVNWTRNYDSRMRRLDSLLAMRAKMTTGAFFALDTSTPGPATRSDAAFENANAP